MLALMGRQCGIWMGCMGRLARCRGREQPVSVLHLWWLVWAAVGVILFFVWGDAHILSVVWGAWHGFSCNINAWRGSLHGGRGMGACCRDWLLLQALASRGCPHLGGRTWTWEGDAMDVSLV